MTRLEKLKDFRKRTIDLLGDINIEDILSEIDTAIKYEKEIENNDWNLKDNDISYGSIPESHLCYHFREIEKLERKIQEDITFMLKNVLDNKHQTNAELSTCVNHFRHILLRRFGF